MCRHLAYIGPEISLAELLLDQPNSLYRQSWAPQDMRGGGTMNADGFGIGWYLPHRRDESDEDREPIRYRRAVPIWADETLPPLARVTRSGAVLAAVRSATAGMPVTEPACAPFGGGRWLFSLNGRVQGWPGSVAKLAERLPVTDLLTMDAPTDSALLWALVRDRLRSGLSVGDALAEVVAEVSAAAPESRLNLLLTDGEEVAATAVTHALWVRHSDGAIAVSSERWDTEDPAWTPVPDGHLLVGSVQKLDITNLELDRTEAESYE